MKHPNRNGNAQRRRELAAERQDAYDKLSLAEKVARARKAPGKALRQKTRLSA